MSEAPVIRPLLPALRDLCAWIEAAGVPGVLIGAVAAGILGRPRFTRDIDTVVMLPQDRWAEFLAQGESFGFAPRINDSLAFAAKSHVLLLRHASSGIEVDISLGVLPFEQEMIARALRIEVEGLRLPLPTPEDLIIMKAVARRPPDVADVEGLLQVHPNLDLPRVRHWLKQFSEALEEPEILDEFERIVARCRR